MQLKEIVWENGREKGEGEEEGERGIYKKEDEIYKKMMVSFKKKIKKQVTSSFRKQNKTLC